MEGPAIHHLLFVDDSLFMCKTSPDQALVLHWILQFYGVATVQNINLQKSSISFGDKVMDKGRSKIQSILEIVNEGGASKYLGLPECFLGLKVELLSYLKDMTQGRLDGLYIHHLSQGGK